MDGNGIKGARTVRVATEEVEWEKKDGEGTSNFYFKVE